MRSRAFRELIALVLIAMLILMPAAAFEVPEAILEWTHRYEAWELDGLFTAMIVLAFLLIPYSYRRWREARNEIAERKLVEEEQQKLVSLIEHSSDFIGVASLEGQMLFLNQAGQELVGLSSLSEVKTKSMFDLLMEDDLPDFKQRVVPAMMHDGRWEGKFRLRHFKTGATIPVEMNAFTMNHPQTGEPIALATVSRDITERERTEEALRASEERHRNLLESAPDAMVVADGDGRIVTVNAQTEKLFGYDRDELLGQPIEMLMPAHLHTAHIRHWAEYREAPRPRQMGADLESLIGRRKDGSELPVDISLSTMETDEGPCVTAVIRDVTEQMRVEEALRASEAKYRTIFENVQDIFYQTDGTGIITEISPSVERVGYTIEGLIGTSVLDVYEDPEERTRIVNALIEHGEIADHEIRLKTGDGRVIDTSINARLLRHPDGTFAGSEGTIRDITERKEAERELEQALEAERDRARRDPLTSVLNHAAIVEELRSLISRDDEGPHAVAMIDVDDLKAVNDTYGHQTGDEMLVAVAISLTRDGAIVGRYGGDEFVVVLPGADRRAAEVYRDVVFAKLADARLADGDSETRVPIQASIGLAIYPQGAETVRDLIKLSDSAMYTAKRRRRPFGPESTSLSRSLSHERAAEVLSDILPLLTAPGAVDDKLRLVSQRLSAGAGYDAVDFSLFAPEPGAPVAQNAFAQGAGDLLEAWTREQRDDSPEAHPIRLLFERAPRPVILDDPWNDEILLESQRNILRSAKLRSVLVAPMIWEDDVIGSLGVASRDEQAFGPADAQFLAAVATQVTAIVRMALFVDQVQSSAARLSQAHQETVLLLAAAAEAHDETTGVHLESVRALTEALAVELGYNHEDASATGLAAALHDIGKIRVPEAVLSSTGLLTGDELEQIKRHTTWGAAFLADRPGLELATTIARCHHERGDGSGYPDGLAAHATPEAATIVSVADALDAMVSDRPYRARRSVDEAVREIVACSGSQFSPKVVEALVRLHERNALPLEPHARADEQAA